MALGEVTTDFAWGDFFGYTAANEFTNWTRDLLTCGGHAHDTDAANGGRHNAGLQVARAGAVIDWDPGQGKYLIRSGSSGFATATIVSTGLIDLVLSGAGMTTTVYRPVFYVADEGVPGSDWETPYAWWARLESITSATAFRVRLRRGATFAAVAQADFSFGIHLFDFT